MGWQPIPRYTLTDDFDADFGVDQWHGTNAFIRDCDQRAIRHHRARAPRGVGGLARAVPARSAVWPVSVRGSGLRGGEGDGGVREPALGRHLREATTVGTSATTASASTAEQRNRGSSGFLVSLAVGAGLVAIAADVHVAPPAATVAGGVVERPPAIRRGAELEPFPVATCRARRDRLDDDVQPRQAGSGGDPQPARPIRDEPQRMIRQRRGGAASPAIACRSAVRSEVAAVEIGRSHRAVAVSSWEVSQSVNAWGDASRSPATWACPCRLNVLSSTVLRKSSIRRRPFTTPL